MPHRSQHHRNIAWGMLRSFVLIGGCLAFGAGGLWLTEGLAPIDAVLGAAMILTGMGPIGRVDTVAGKLFLTGYALFSGVVFLGAAAMLYQPIFQRFLHRFHLEIEKEEDDE